MCMGLEVIENNFKQKVSNEIHLVQEGVNRYRVFTPFQFEDGDHLSIVLKKIGSDWILSDEGHTYMHLSYGMDISSLEKGTRQKIIEGVLSNFNIKDKEGVLITKLDIEKSGDIFFSYIQGLFKITDITYLKKENTRSTFLEDFKHFISERIPKGSYQFDYYETKFDPNKKYIIDCKFILENKVKPYFIYAIPNESKCKDVTISLHQFEKLGLNFHSIGIFQDQEEINRKVLARFSDVCEKQFSCLNPNDERIYNYLMKAI